MAIEAVTTADFIGRWKIVADAYQSEYLSNYLDQWQPQLIHWIVSVDAFNEIEDNGIASKPKWIDLFNGSRGYYNSACDKKMYHFGVSDALKGLLYFLYVKDRVFDPTNSGNVQPLQEVSKRTNNVHNGVIAATRWNQSIAKLRGEILPFIENYEDITGVISSSVDLGGGSYTLNLPSTFYLSDGETVTINSTKYIVSNLIENVSFDISGETIGKDFTGDSVLWKPYEDFPLSKELCDNLQYVSI